MELLVTDFSTPGSQSDEVVIPVEQLKLRLKFATEQRLTFGGQQLDTNRTIGSYNLTPHSSINMTARMVGGSL